MQRIIIIIILVFTGGLLNLSLAFSEEVPVQGGQGGIEAVSILPNKANGVLEEIKWLQAESMITIATRHKTPISKAPGIVTVITSKQWALKDCFLNDGNVFLPFPPPFFPEGLYHPPMLDPSDVPV